MNDLNLITACQSGFRKCHSMATALVKIYDDFLKGFDNGNFVGVVFIDLRKAFDTVDHGIYDAPDAIKQILDLYANDTTLQASEPDLSVLEQILNEDLESL